jgi:hypothetical protein
VDSNFSADAEASEVRDGEVDEKIRGCGYGAT